MDNRAHHPPPSALRNLLTHEAAGGLILIGSAAVALIVANSAAAPVYFSALAYQVAGLSVLHWINDALMVLFFVMVGLEIKRELLDGQLASWSHRILPGVGAVGGMALPALVYVALNLSSPGTLKGWGIPAATDIAFALSILAILGSRVPVSLKVFLTALAILDDMGAIVIIALFYAGEISPLALGGAVLAFAALLAINRLGVMRLAPYHGEADPAQQSDAVKVPPIRPVWPLRDPKPHRKKHAAEHADLFAEEQPQSAAERHRLQEVGRADASKRHAGVGKAEHRQHQECHPRLDRILQAMQR
jgi:hypothetical protein